MTRHTALQLWIVKTSIETPILRCRRIAAAGNDADAETPSATEQDVPPDVSTDASTSGAGPTPDVASAAPPPQPYVHIPDAIGGNQSKRRRIGQVQAVPSPPQGVLSLTIIDPATIATITTNIRSHRREAVLRIPHPFFLNKP